MRPSTFDPCLLITLEPTDSIGRIGIIGMQTDNTLRISNHSFIKQEESALKTASFLAKDLEFLTTSKPLTFNSLIMTLETDRLILV